MTIDDPLHTVAGPATSWTTVNIGEALPGVPTALTWTYFHWQTEQSMREGFHDIGALRRDELAIPDDIDQRFTAIFHGHPALNLSMMDRMGNRIPGTSAAAMETQLFGAGNSAPTEATAEPRRYPVVAARLPLAAWRSRRELLRLRRELAAWWRRTVAQPIPYDRARGLLTQARSAHEVVNRHQVVTTMISQGLYQQVDLLCAGADLPELTGALLTSDDMEEAQFLTGLWQLAQQTLTIDDFVAEHGYHGPREGELSNLTWREDSSPLEGLVDVYRRRGDGGAPDVLLGERLRARDEAQHTLLKALPRHRVPAATLLLWLARAYLPLREIGRATFLRADDVARAAVRTLGDDLVDRGRIDNRNDAFHLTYDELLADPAPNAGEIVAARRAAREAYQRITLPVRWVGVAPIEPLQPRTAECARITGIGASHGIAEGRAVVVHDPADVELDDGAILVTTSTDPSWAALFFAAAGVVVDIGGPLSHGAIVARELGIPCVINTGTATREIRTGDLIRIDGSTGAVEILRRRNLTAADR